MQKIQSTSHILYLFFRILCWIIPLITTYFILFNIEQIINWGAWSSLLPTVQLSAKYGQTTPSLTLVSPHDFSLWHRVIILLIQMIPMSITVLICQRLAQLFRLYEQGNLFEKENIRLIKQISIYMISGELLQIIYQPLMTAALSFNNPPGERVISLTFGTANASTLITGFIILVASWIVKEAYQLKSESQLTI